MFAKSTLSSRLESGKKHFLMLPLKAHLPRSFSSVIKSSKPTFSQNFNTFFKQPKYVNNVQLLHHLSTKPAIAINIKRSYSTEAESSPKPGGFFNFQKYSEKESEEIRKTVQKFENFYLHKRIIGIKVNGRKIGIQRLWLLAFLLLLFIALCYYDDIKKMDYFQEQSEEMRMRIEAFRQAAFMLASIGKLPENYRETQYGFGEITWREIYAKPIQEPRFKYFEIAFNIMSSFGIAFFYSTLMAKWHINRYLKRFPEEIPNFTENVKNFIILRRSALCSLTVLAMTSCIQLFAYLWPEEEKGGPRADFLYTHLSFWEYWRLFPRKDFPLPLEDSPMSEISERYYINSRLIFPPQIEEKLYKEFSKQSTYKTCIQFAQVLAFLVGSTFSSHIIFPFVFSKEISRIIAQPERNFLLRFKTRFYMLPGDDRVQYCIGVEGGTVEDPALFPVQDEYSIYKKAKEFRPTPLVYEEIDPEIRAPDRELSDEELDKIVAIYNQRRNFEEQLRKENEPFKGKL